MANDIPKATIAVLLVLTILVSVIGTWTVLESINAREAPLAVERAVPTSEGNVGLILEGPKETKEDSANIRFEIK